MLLTEDSNTAVGVVQGIQGIVNLVTAFPFSVVGDRYKRQFVLRLAGAIGFLAIGVTSWTLLWVESHWRDKLYYILCATMGLWGVWMGGGRSPPDLPSSCSIFLDSRLRINASKVSQRRPAPQCRAF